jgi:RNA polymerase sigma-70 factor (ECF subfamily)
MVDEVALADVALARACVLGEPAALERFETEVLQPVAHRMRARHEAHVVDEIIQATRVKLLVTTEANEVGLQQYRGRGSLVGFVRVVASRLLIDGQRKVRELPEPDLNVLVDSVHPDPELEYLRRHYGAALQAAIAGAWRALPTHERFIVELQLHHRLGVDEIATLYQIHRGTAARRIASARAALAAATRDELRTSLGIGGDTLESILRLITTSVSWPALEITSDTSP